MSKSPDPSPDPTKAIIIALHDAREANRREPSTARLHVIKKLEEAKMWERFHWETCIEHGGSQ
jgi:hypothetical protein